jgi:hypothetical protein
VQEAGEVLFVPRHWTHQVLPHSSIYGVAIILHPVIPSIHLSSCHSPYASILLSPHTLSC